MLLSINDRTIPDLVAHKFRNIHSPYCLASPIRCDIMSRDTMPLFVLVQQRVKYLPVILGEIHHSGHSRTLCVDIVMVTGERAGCEGFIPECFTEVILMGDLVQDIDQALFMHRAYRSSRQLTLWICFSS